MHARNVLRRLADVSRLTIVLITTGLQGTETQMRPLLGVVTTDYKLDSADLVAPQPLQATRHAF